MSKIKSLFLDGQMVKARTELMEALAPGVVQGEGVFETMRVYGGTIFALEMHFNRLSRGCKLLNIRAPYSKRQLEQYLYHTIKMNVLKEARIRLAVWRENRHSRVAIVCQNIHHDPGRTDQKGFKAMISNIQRKKTRFSNIKSIDYLCFRRAFEEAERRGYDEAVLLNNRREIVEGSRTNIFYVKKGVLYTPAVKCGCLNGITRKIVLQCARHRKIPFKAVAAGARELFQAEEAFVTNSVMGIMPLTFAEGHRIGRGKAGPITKKLLSAYDTIVHFSCPVKDKPV